MAVNPEFFMRDANHLAARGFPAPNPHVGCVIVKDGVTIGSGWHDYAGGPHAEIVALAEAGANAEGSDVYVTLEPCAHFGRTPPCCDALIAAKVKRVFIGMVDPNSGATGGVQKLLEAGIEVIVGMLEEEVQAVNRMWLTAMKLGRPFVTVKMAVTMDGFVDRVGGGGAIISSPESKDHTMKIRADHGVILVGRGTIASDNPKLNLRGLPLAKNPITRVVLDPSAILVGSYRAFDPTLGPFWHVGVTHHSSIKSDGQVDLDKLLKELWDAGHRAVLVEGGPTTIKQFAEAGLVDRLDIIRAPIWFHEGVPAHLDVFASYKLTLRETRQFENDAYSSYWLER